MADDILGTLAVEITGDYSGLTQALNDAATAATEGAHQIEAAAEGGFNQLAESLVAVGEALAVTEGLKEFGQEALVAFGTVQSVTIGLTQLTGSVEAAGEAIEQIKQLAATEPFAFPDIAPTVQKMVALGVSTEQIQGVMQAAANAAAATGNSFQQVANSIDRMSLSGTASARTLTQLGISTKDLGDAMGVTATEATAAFKALDQSQRIEVLEEALDKFAGAAIAQAQGIAGQWQIFQNQFEEVMVGVGQAIAPVISDILKFGSTVLAEVQSAIDWFNKLPEPVRDTAVAIGIAVAAIAPLAAGLGAIALGISAMSGLLPAAVGALSTLGIVATTAATAEEGVAVATVAAGEAATESAAAFSVMGLSLGPVSAGIIAVGAAVALIHFSGIQDDLTALAQAFLSNRDNIEIWVNEVKIAATSAGNFLQSLIGLPPGLEALIAALPKAQDAFKLFAQELVPASMLVPALTGALTLMGGQISDMTPLIAKMLDKFQAVPPAFAQTQAAANSLSRGLQAIVSAQANANTTLASAKQNLDDAKAALDAGAISANTYNRALVDYDKALLAANPHTKDFADTLAGVQQAAALAVEKEQSLVTALAQAQAKFDSGNISAALFVEVYNKAQQAAKSLGDTLVNVEAEEVKLNQASVDAQVNFGAQRQVFADLLLKYEAGIIDLNELEASYKKVTAAATAAGSTFYDQAAAMLAAADAASKQEGALKDNIATLAGLQNSALQTNDVLIAETNVFKQIQSEAAAMGVTITDVGGSYTATAKVITPAIQSLIDQINGWMNQQGLANSVIQQGFTVVRDATTGIVTYKGGVEQATQAVQNHAAAHTALQGTLRNTVGAIEQVTGSLGDYIITTQSGDSTIITFTDDLNSQAAAFNDVAAAAGAASAAVEGFDQNTTSGVSGNTGGSQIADIASAMKMFGATSDEITAFLGSSGFVAAGGSGYNSNQNYESVSEYNASITALAKELNDSTITTLDQFGNQLLALGPPLKSTAAAHSATAAAVTTTATAATTAASALTDAATAATTVATATTDASTAITAASTSVQQAAVATALVANAAVAAILQVTGAAGANAQLGNVTSSAGLNLGALTFAPGQAGSNAAVGSLTPGTGAFVGPPATFNLTVQNNGTVVGTNGMTQLVQMLQQGVVTQLRQAGAKV